MIQIQQEKKKAGLKPAYFHFQGLPSDQLINLRVPLKKSVTSD
jgi:hypothetical protein